jgi:hypothetical protein
MSGESIPIVVVSLRPFLRVAKAIGLTDAEIQEIEVQVAYDPEQGDLVEGTGGVRKRRVALSNRNKGKSGGGRVFTVFFHMDMPVYIVAMVDKSDAGNLSKAERNELAKLTGQLKAAQERKRK